MISWACMIPVEASWAHCLSIGASRACRGRRRSSNLALDQVQRGDREVLEARHGRRDDFERRAVTGTLSSSARAAAPMSKRANIVSTTPIFTFLADLVFSP